MTYENFEVPNNAPICVNCILDWNMIDAFIYVDGCQNVSSNIDDFGTLDSDGNLAPIGSFYQCNGTWKIESSGQLMQWQKTYGKVEIWEQDASDR